MELHKRYGLATAIAMVVGIVVGSGVFFKAEKVLAATGGDLRLGILAWVIGGLIMVICAYTFSVMAARYQYVNGVVDYAEATVGKGYAYSIGWFLAVIYYPTLTSVLAWVSARYASVLLGFSIVGPECMVLAGFFLIQAYALNTLSPVLAGRFQVSTTVIKMIPLLLMAVLGTAAGLRSGMTVENFTTVVTGVDTGPALFTAVCATAFAYEGWIVATSINAELKNGRRDLPRALVAGALIVVAAYILYYIGLAGSVSNRAMMESGETAVRTAFEEIFSRAGGTALFVFVVVSCLGTLNGLMLGCVRGLYSLAARGAGPRPGVFREVGRQTNMPGNSAVFGLMMCTFWLLYFYGASLTGTGWFGPFSFDTSELPIITIYAAYLPILLLFMKKEKGLSAFKRFVMPALSCLSCLFMMVAACFSHGRAVLYYLMVFAVIMLTDALFSGKKKKERR